MKIVVIGMGKIGTSLIESLADEGHDLTAVDINAKVIDELVNTLQKLMK